MPEKTATRALILEAVVTCIEKYGAEKVTTRKIAQEAGTNIASINYHFRSKNELMQEALSMTMKHMLEDVFVAIDDTSRSFEAALNAVFFYLLSGSVLFPGITRAHLYRAVMERDRDSLSSQAMNRVFDGLCRRAASEYPSRDPGELRVLISQMMSSILFSMLAPEFFPVPRQYRLTSARHAQTLADSYTQQFKALV